jgi:hypothetical protein
MSVHKNCRNNVYPGSNVRRLPVPDHLVKWSTPWPVYAPPVFNHPSLDGKPWADPDVK